MRTKLNYLANLGTEYISDKNSIKQTRISNQLCIFGVVSGFLTLAYSFFVSVAVEVDIIVTGLTLLLVFPLLLNFYGKIQASRIIHVLVSHLILFVLPIIFGPESHLQYFLIFGIGIPLIILDKKVGLTRWLLIFIVIPLWLYLEWHFLHFDPLIPLSPEYIEVSRPLNDVMLFVILIILFIIFTKEGDRHIDKIEIQKNELESLNSNLDEALERANDATKSKSQFLANMSHEIRTPMNGVIGACDLLKVSELTKEQGNLVSIISSSSDNLLGLINDILDFSKIEAGKLDIESYSFNLLNTIERVSDQFKLIANKKNIELITFIEEDVPFNVKGDSMRISQILINLVGNAIKFTDEGQIYINVRCHNCDSNDSKLKIEFNIEDTGTGIAPDKIDSIFESFTQEDGSTSRIYGGSGLGTTISKSLVELMNGTIKAVSPNPNNPINSNSGSIFSFTIELERGTLNPTPKKAYPDLEQVKCLLVDDNETNLYVIEKLISKWGITVEVAKNGHQALQIARTFKPNLIVMDYHMPELDGLQTVKLIEKEGFSFDFKTILLSSDSSISLSKVVNDYAIDECIYKPVKQSSLLNAILKTLSVEISGEQIVPTELVEAYDNTDYSILLAEDNEINQKVAIMLFKKLGLNIDIAENGKVALEMIDKKEYDLIFMDFHMPELDGIETTKAIRELNIKTPIIAMTANAMIGDKEQCIEAGMNEYLSKPVKLEDLKGVLDLLLKKK